MLIIDYSDEDVKELIGEYVVKAVKKLKLKELKETRRYHIECNSLSLNYSVNSLKCIITEAINRLNIPQKITILQIEDKIDEIEKEEIGWIKLPCGTWSNGAQCMCDICFGFMDDPYP